MLNSRTQQLAFPTAEVYGKYTKQEFVEAGMSEASAKSMFAMINRRR